LVLVFRGDAPVQFTPVEASRHNGARAFALRERAFRGVEPEVGLAPGLVGAVAGEAVVREDRPDVAGEGDGRLRGPAELHRREEGEARQHGRVAGRKHASVLAVGGGGSVLIVMQSGRGATLVSPRAPASTGPTRVSAPPDNDPVGPTLLSAQSRVRRVRA